MVMAYQEADMSRCADPSPPLPRADPILERVTVAIAGGHMALALIMLMGKAGFGRRTSTLIPAVAEHPMWIIANMVAALLIVATVAQRHWRRYAMVVSTGVYAGWAILMGAWAVQLAPDATWAVTLLGLVLALVSFATNGQWSVKED